MVRRKTTTVRHTRLAEAQNCKAKGSDLKPSAVLPSLRFLLIIQSCIRDRVRKRSVMPACLNVTYRWHRFSRTTFLNCKISPVFPKLGYFWGGWCVAPSPYSKKVPGFRILKFSSNHPKTFSSIKLQPC